MPEKILIIQANILPARFIRCSII